MIRLIVNGAAGRMGRRIVALTGDDKAVEVVAAFEMDGHPLLGNDAGVVAGTDELRLPITTRADAEAGTRLDDDLVAVVGQFANARRGQTDPVLMILDFFRYTDQHNPITSVVSPERACRNSVRHPADRLATSPSQSWSGYRT